MSLKDKDANGAAAAATADTAHRNGNGIELPQKQEDDSTVTNNKAYNSKPSPSSFHPASFRSLFQFAQPRDLVLFGLGCFFCFASSATMPAINIVFGDVIDAIAQPLDVEKIVATGVRALSILAVYGFVTFFLSFWCCGQAAGNLANAWRMQYLEALLKQDMTFFDNAQPGSLTMGLSDSAMTLQAGLADKFAQMLQGVFQFMFGFAIAFWFGPKLAGVLLACVPLLGLVTTAMFTWGSEDGLFGKEAYESASTIANEAMTNIRTVMSLNAEPMVRYAYITCSFICMYECVYSLISPLLSILLITLSCNNANDTFFR